MAHDDANIQMLLEKLPADCLARKLVAPFAQLPFDEAAKAAQRILDAVKDAQLTGEPSGSAEAT